MESYILLTQVIFHDLFNLIRFTDTHKKIVTLCSCTKGWNI